MLPRFDGSFVISFDWWHLYHLGGVLLLKGKQNFSDEFEVSFHIKTDCKLVAVLLAV